MQHFDFLLVFEVFLNFSMFLDFLGKRYENGFIFQTLTFDLSNSTLDL